MTDVLDESFAGNSEFFAEFIAIRILKFSPLQITALIALIRAAIWLMPLGRDQGGKFQILDYQICNSFSKHP